MAMPDMHKAGCNHATLAVNPHSRCDRCKTKAGEELCTVESRCDECSNTSAKDMAAIVAQRRKNEKRRKTNPSASPARSECSVSHSTSKQHSSSSPPPSGSSARILNPDMDEAVINLESDSDNTDSLSRARSSILTAASDTLLSPRLGPMLGQVGLNTTFQSPPLPSPAPSTSTPTLSVKDLAGLVQQQSQELAWFRSQFATQKFPSPSATVSRPPDSPGKRDRSAGDARSDDGADSYLPPSGHVASNVDQAPVLSDIDSAQGDVSAAHGHSDSDSEAAGTHKHRRERYSGGEDYDTSRTRQHKRKLRRDDSSPEDRESPLFHSSIPLPMRVVDPRSPAKSLVRGTSRRPIRTPSPPERRRYESPLTELNLTDSSTPSQEEFSFRKVLSAIASLSGAQSGPPKSDKDTKEFPLTMKSQASVTPPDALIALETTEAVKNAILKRQANFRNDDLKNPTGRTLSRLHSSVPSMNVKPLLYRTSDGAVPMEALSQPSDLTIWMPDVKPDSDIPLQERDAKVFETLSRQGLNIASMQDHTLAAIRAVIQPDHENEFVCRELIQTLSLSIRDMVKVCSLILTSIVQLRRDAFLAHAWDMGACKLLRHSEILFQSELFPPAELAKITEDWRRKREDAALKISTQRFISKDNRSKPYQVPKHKTNGNGKHGGRPKSGGQQGNGAGKKSGQGQGHHGSRPNSPAHSSSR